MNASVSLRQFVIGLILAPVVFAAAELKPVKPAPPELKVDATPVTATAAGGQPASYADALKPVQRAVVSVYSTKIVRQQLQVNPFLRQFFDVPQERESRQEGLGSGVIVTPDGYILTNNHVVEGADELKVSLADDREFIAKVIGADPKTDVAVIKIEAEKLPTVTLADSDKLRVGDVVFAVGNPLDIGQTVTMGIVSATGRSLGLLDGVAGYESFVQTDAAINQGNSGGALVDAKGRLIGINTAIVSPSRGNIGLGFAIPVNLAASVMHSLVETGKVQRGYLGVAAETLTPDLAEALGVDRETKGVMVTNLPEESPAREAGIQRNDILTKVDGHPIASQQDLRLQVAQMSPDTEVAVDYLRNGKPGSLKVKLGRLDDGDSDKELIPGVTIQALTDEQRTRLRLDPQIDGVLIGEVAADSDYADRLAAGMIIVEINRSPVREVGKARALLRPGRNLLLVYLPTAGVFRPVAVTVR